MENLWIEGTLLAGCIAVLAVYLVFIARRAGLGRAMGPVQLLARLPLEPRRCIYVVRVVDRVLVVGASEGGICELGQLPPECLDRFPDSQAPLSFADALRAAAFGRVASVPREGQGHSSGESRGASERD